MLVTTGTPPPTATAVPPLPSATATIKVQPIAPTAPLPAVTPITDTLVLYTVGIPDQPAPDQPVITYWAFRTLPPLPGLDPAVFDTFYGPYENMEPGRFFLDFRPQLSPDGRYILVAGLVSYPQYDVEGTGTWLIDLQTGVARQLLPDGVIATWSPNSDAITYVVGDTLYTLSIAEGATPTPLFQNTDLWNLYAKWSPDGRWIAAVTGVQHEPIGEAQTDLTFTYWLVPADGGAAHELAQRETYGAGYIADEVSWSPDGQFLLMHAQVYDLEGNPLLPDYTGGADWIPGDSKLIVNSSEGLSLITVDGAEILRVGDGVHRSGVDEWDFSHDGRRLAYALPRDEAGVGVAVYDLENGQTQVIGSIAGANHVNLLRWSGDDSQLIASVVFDDSRFGIWTLEAQPDGAIEQLIESAELIEVVPYSAR